MKPTDITLIILAPVMPFIVIWIRSGLCTIDALINIFLSFLGWLPGIIHAWYVVYRESELERLRVEERERVLKIVALHEAKLLLRRARSKSRGRSAARRMSRVERLAGDGLVQVEGSSTTSSSSSGSSSSSSS